MKTHQLLIAEDDPLTQRICAQIVEQHFPEVEVVGRVASIAEAHQVVLSEKPDLLLLDIQLTDGTAFDLLSKIELYDFKVIFMSAFQGYIEEAIQFSAVGFLAKPFDVSDFVMALDKAMAAIDADDYLQQLEVLFTNVNRSVEARTVIFPTANGVRAVKLSALQYGEALPGGAEMVLDTGERLFVPRPLRRYEQMFAPYSFIRCHPLYLVNFKKVSFLDPVTLTITMENGMQLPMEERKIEKLTERYQEMLN